MNIVQDTNTKKIDAELQHFVHELLKSIDAAESNGFIKEADDAHKSFMKIAQAPGNAYSNFDPSTIPPAISAILANLNYKVTELTSKQQQMSQQLGGAQQQQKPAQQNTSTMQNQNPINPDVVNYIQTPGSNPAPIDMDGGEINV